jgi:hypothetical protein
MSKEDKPLIIAYDGHKVEVPGKFIKDQRWDMLYRAIEIMINNIEDKNDRVHVYL